MRLTLCTLFNMNYHFVNTYYYCVHFSNYIVLFFFCHFCIGTHTGASGPLWNHVHAKSRARCRTASHTLRKMSLWWRILMRSNNDGNDPVHLFASVSLPPLPTAWRTSVGLHEANVMSSFIKRGGGGSGDSAQIYHSRNPLTRNEKHVLLIQFS